MHVSHVVDFIEFLHETQIICIDSLSRLMSLVAAAAVGVLLIEKCYSNFLSFIVYIYRAHVEPCIERYKKQNMSATVRPARTGER